MATSWVNLCAAQEPPPHVSCSLRDALQMPCGYRDSQAPNPRRQNMADHAQAVGILDTTLFIPGETSNTHQKSVETYQKSVKKRFPSIHTADIAI
jgi:hypothetical protein